MQSRYPKKSLFFALSSWFVALILACGSFAQAQPSFTPGPDIQEDESSDTLSISIANWAQNISDGGSGQPLSFIVSEVSISSNLNLTAPLAISSNGTLSCQVAPYSNGVATYDVYLSDGTTNSAVTTLSITIDPVNFPPSEISLSKQFVNELSPVGTLVGTFTVLDPDPEDITTLQFVAGFGSDDNGSFTLQAEDLLTAEVFEFDRQQVYSIRVRASDGVISLEEIFQIDINKQAEPIVFANAITPNGDGENDTWEIQNIEGFPDAQIRVFDSSGILVFESTGRSYVPWDGQFNSKELAKGTYYYIIDLNVPETKVLKGTLTILL